MADPDTNAQLERLRVERTKLLDGLLATNTHTGYRYDWIQFERWCQTIEQQALPASPQVVSLYTTHMLTAGQKVSTATRRVSAIAHTHRVNSWPSPVTPEVREVLLGAKRLRAEPVRQVRPLTVQQIRTIAELLTKDGTAIALRNRAMIVVGFCSALRQSTLVALHLDDVEFVEQGVVLRVRQEKQDREGKKGRLIGLPHGKHRQTCPVNCLREWIEKRGSAAGPLFTHIHERLRFELPLDPQVVCHVVQACVKRLGLDLRDRWGGHSLRSGFVTEAGEAGAGDLVIAAQTGHRDMDTLRRYFRKRDCFRGNPCSLLDL